MAWFHFEIICYILWFILIIFSIFSTIKASSQNSKTWMKKRNLSLFYALNVGLIISIVSFLFFGICCVHYIHSSFMTSLSTALWVLSVFIWVFILVTKNWMIYYTHKWTFYIQKSKWQQIINPKVVDNDIKQNWFIANHQTYGQLKYVIKLFGSIAICCGVIVTSFWVLSAYFAGHSYILFICISSGSTIMIYVPWISLYAYCVWNTPPLNDAFKIHYESMLHAKLLCCTTPNTSICTIYLIISGDMRAFYVACIIGSILMFCMVFVSTVYIPRQLKEDSSMTLKMKCILDHSYHQSAEKITLQMILSNETTLNLFMNHLSSEYSMEILLSCIEIMQYQNYVKTLLDTVNTVDTMDNVTDIQFPKDIPISEIVHMKEDLILIPDSDKLIIQHAKIKANKLYEKYINQFAEFQINISGIMRDSLSEKLEYLNELLSNDLFGLKELYMVFEECKQEMMTLQSISFQRFRQKEFDAVAAVFNVNIK